MTELILLPDIELLVRDFLVAQAEVVAFFTSGTAADGSIVSPAPTPRVYSELPKAKVFPLVRVHQFGALPIPGQPRWLQTSTVQIDAYGGAKRTAKLLAETCAATMDARMCGQHTEGVVTGVSFTGMADLADDTFDPARPRWIFVAQISAHP